MNGITRDDLNVLQVYADEKNRERYWNYLAQHQGSDGYGLLALGVVRNDNMPGSVANQFAQNYADSANNITLTEREWENFGIDLIQNDLSLREKHFQDGRADLALNLPALDVQQAHTEAFNSAHIDANAWTPNRLLDAAHRTGGEPEMEKVWHTMLDNNARGRDRFLGTMKDLIARYDDPQLHAVEYGIEMGKAYLSAATALPYSDPNRIGSTGFYYQYDASNASWYAIQSNPTAGMGGIALPLKVSDTKLIDELNDARAVRLERNAKADQIAPGDPYQQIAKSPFVLAQHTSESPQHRVAAVSARDVAPRLYDELKSQLPAQTSPERLAQISFAAKQAGIKPGQIAAIEAQDTTLHVIGQTPGCRASIDLSTPPPSAQQTLQQAQAHDQQQALQQTNSPSLAQHAQQNTPGMTMRHPGMG